MASNYPFDIFKLDFQDGTQDGMIMLDYKSVMTYRFSENISSIDFFFHVKSQFIRQK